MIGTTRPNPKILAPNGHIIFQTALKEKAAHHAMRRFDFSG
jgi:hypothetical protein